MAGTREIAHENGKKGGRPKGSTSSLRLADYVSEEDKKNFIEFIMSNYMSDMRLATWLGDHLYAKPRQDIDVTSGGEKLPTPILAALPKKDEKTD